MPTRQLPIKSAYNFRDLGGYLGKGNKSVKWRNLLRASDFNELADDDALYLASLPVVTVVDFRSNAEFVKTPDRVIPSVKNVYNLSIDAGDLVPKLMTLVYNQSIDDDERFSLALDLMFEMYRKLVTEYNSVYRRFFEILQRGDAQPLLFHCSAGKDRTGVASALLLSSLGVDRDVIYDDYMMTNQTLQGKYDHLDYLGRISLLFKSVRQDFLDTAFYEIEKRHGSVAAYLTKELSVDMDKMQKLYLE